MCGWIARKETLSQISSFSFARGGGALWCGVAECTNHSPVQMGPGLTCGGGIFMNWREVDGNSQTHNFPESEFFSSLLTKIGPPFFFFFLPPFKAFRVEEAWKYSPSCLFTINMTEFWHILKQYTLLYSGSNMFSNSIYPVSPLTFIQVGEVD